MALIPGDKLTFFLVSTFGEGDPSDNLHDFWGWLQQGHADGAPLGSLRYMAFGLGNSFYKHYNKVVDVVVEHLDRLGANALLPTGRADDSDGGTEEHYLEWKEQVFATLRAGLGYEERQPVYEPTLKVVEDDSLEPIDLHHGGPWEGGMSKKLNSGLSAVNALQVKHSRELFSASAGRHCIHMEVDLSNHPSMKYKTGDHLGVWPINPEMEIQRLLRVMGLHQKMQMPVMVKSLEPGMKPKVPSPTCVAALFTHYLEINAQVSRETLAQMVQFAPNESAKQELARLSSSKKVYAEFLTSRYVNLGRLMEYLTGEEGAWKDLPLSFVVEALPAMQPRYYSISSSSVVQPRQIAITAVVSNTDISSTDRIPGLSTNYLLALRESLEQTPQLHPHGLTYPLHGPDNALQGGKLHAHIRKSTFKLPALASQPIVMVAAGTGIAPFRAFLQERARIKSMEREVGPTMLFFGCRNEEQDFLYRDELLELQEKLGDSFTLVTAFSRPQAGKKIYVQDRIAEHADKVCELLGESNAYFYICGSAAMAREVSNVVCDKLQGTLSLDETQMKGFAERQKKQKRWQQDVWG